MRKTWSADRSNTPRQWTGTLVITAALVATFLLGWVFSGARQNPVWDALAYTDGLDRPWTILTYPFSNPLSGVLYFAFGCWVLYQYLAQLERRLGPWGIVLFFFAVSLLGGIGYAVGSIVAGSPSSIYPNLFLPLQVVIFTWAACNWNGSLSLFGIVPMSCKVLGYLCLAGVVVTYGWTVPLVGVFTALPILFGWLYARDRIPFMRFGQVPDIAGAKKQKKDKEEFDSYMDNVKRREQDRKEKDKLRKMLESSLQDDDEDEC